VLQDGRLAQEGPYQELSQREGPFASMLAATEPCHG